MITSFLSEDGGSSILQYIHTHSPHDMASHSTIMYSKFIKDGSVYVSKIQDSLRGLIERIIMQNQSRNSPGHLWLLETSNHVWVDVLLYITNMNCLSRRAKWTQIWQWGYLTLILRRSRTGTVWFYTSTSNKRAARPKLYTKSLTRDLKLMYSRLTLVRISINL